MRFSASSLLSVVLVVVLAPFLNGQKSAVTQAAAAQLISNSSSDAPDACPHLFTAGTSSSSTFIQYCVTDVGAITSIQTPFGHFHIGAGGEGYGLCQESPAVEYHDYAATWSTNWNFPQILTLNGSLIKISRTTSDGNWTLVQTISKVAATGSIKIVMALTNNQSVDKVAYLVRFADAEPDGHKIDHYAMGAGFQSAFAWSKLDFHYGLQLENTGKWTAYQQGFIQSISSGPNACAFAFNSVSTSAFISDDFMGRSDGSILYTYADTVPAHGTKTVTMTYRGT